MKELKDLKAGDYVILQTKIRTSLQPIQAITPKGFIKVCGRLFSQSGRERTTDIWNVDHIYVPTDDDIKRFENKQRVALLKTFITQWVKYNDDLDRLEKISNIIKGEK